MANKKDEPPKRQRSRANKFANPPTPSKFGVNPTSPNLTHAIIERAPIIEEITRKLELLVHETAETSRDYKKAQQELVELEGTVDKLGHLVEADGVVVNAGFDKIEKQFDTVTATLNDKIQALPKPIPIKEIESSIASSLAASNENTRNDTNASIANQIAAKLDGFALSPTNQLWKDRLDSAQKSFKWSAWLVVGLFGILPIFVWLFSGSILAFIADTNLAKTAIGENASVTVVLAGQISRLIFVTLPAVAYFWLIRLVVRFAVRSMLLMDDAAARQTMLDTYLHLVEQDKDVTTDRPLILEALFRRTPGHGSDTIDPPDLTDILKVKNMGVSSKPTG